MALSTLYLMPTSDVVTTGFTRNGAGAEATFWELLAAHDWDVSDDTHYARGSNSSNNERWLELGLGGCPDVLSISSVQLCWRSRGAATTTGMKVDVRLKNVITATGWVGAIDSTWADQVRTSLVNPTTGLPFTKADLANNIQLGVYDSDSGGEAADFSKAYAKVSCTLAAVRLSDYIRIGSMHVWFRRLPGRKAEWLVPPELGLLLVPGAFLPASEFCAPSESGNGWGRETWQKRPTWVESVAVDAKTDLVRIVCRDALPFLCLWRDSAQCVKDNTGVWGVSRFDLGCARSFTRASKAYVEAPSDDRSVSETVFGVWSVRTCSEDVECFAGDRIVEKARSLIEEERTNYVKRSSFKDGSGAAFTDWTPAGTIAENTSIVLFEDIRRGPKVGVMVPPGSHSLTSLATDSIPANTIISISLDAYIAAIGGGYAYCHLTRGVDGWYLNPATKTWQAGAVGVFTEADAGGRHKCEGFSVGANATTLTVTLATASGYFYAWHVQIEAGAWCSSRIVTSAAAVTRPAAILTVSNNAAARCVHNAQGALYAHVDSEWSSAQIGNTNKTIYYVAYDANNKRHLRYNGTLDRWEYVVTVGGTAYTAYLAGSVVAGTTYKICGRQTGSHGELGLTPFTIGLLVDGVKGTDVVMPSAPTEAATCNLEIGSAGGAEFWDGRIWQRHSFAHVPTDIMVARGLY